MSTPNRCREWIPATRNRLRSTGSARFGLRASFEFCVTANATAGPAAADPCMPLPGATVINNGVGGDTYRDTLTLDASMYRPTADFYIRATALIYLWGTTPPSDTSNRVEFDLAADPGESLCAQSGIPASAAER